MNNWETYTINITHDGKNFHTDEEMEDVTNRFETELFKLVKKYQGQAGLKIDARNSVDQTIVEYP